MSAVRWFPVRELPEAVIPCPAAGIDGSVGTAGRVRRSGVSSSRDDARAPVGMVPVGGGPGWASPGAWGEVVGSWADGS